ncbi:acetylglutamate semialdehyde dehydrogenase [Paenibacillus sp. RC84]|uniref:restriction endonuclease n=1 Tax=Paenibacillus sp. RC84 TaxID=3156252 RepID=UPI0035176924
MNNQGFSIEEYLERLDYKEQAYKELTRLKDSVLNDYKILLDELIEVNSKTEAQGENIKSQKGKALENLVTFLIKSTGLFEVHTNIRTDTNEIDQILELSFRGKHFEKYLPFDGQLFLSECKNYKGKVSVTWVGKFHSLLVSNSTRYGFLFSYHGFTGKEWRDATGLTKKLFLLKEKMAEKVYILDFNISDFHLILNGHSFLEIIDAKIKALITSTSIEQYLNLIHPALEGPIEQKST